MVTQSTYESLELLKAALTIKHTVESEVPGVSIILSECGKWFLHSKDGKTLPRRSHLGGYGTGMYVAMSDSSPGVPFVLKDDREPVEIDLVSLDPNKSGYEALTLYNLLIKLESAHSVTDHNVTWLNVKRDTSGANDKFIVETQTAMKFKLVNEEKEPEEDNKKKRKKSNPPKESKVTAKTVFSQGIEAITKSELVTTAFRFRFDKINKSLRPQKPYVVTARILTLEADKPCQI